MAEPVADEKASERDEFLSEKDRPAIHNYLNFIAVMVFFLKSSPKHKSKT